MPGMHQPEDRPEADIGIKVVAGRHPHRPQPLWPENMVVAISNGSAEGLVRVRIDDNANREAWMEIEIDVRKLIEHVLGRGQTDQGQGLLFETGGQRC